MSFTTVLHADTCAATDGSSTFCTPGPTAACAGGSAGTLAGSLRFFDAPAYLCFYWRKVVVCNWSSVTLIEMTMNAEGGQGTFGYALDGDCAKAVPNSLITLPNALVWDKNAVGPPTPVPVLANIVGVFMSGYAGADCRDASGVVSDVFLTITSDLDISCGQPQPQPPAVSCDPVQNFPGPMPQSTACAPLQNFPGEIPPSPAGQLRTWTVPRIVYDPGTGPVTLLPVYPPRKVPFYVKEAVRHDNLSSAGVKEVVFERTDEFLEFEMEWVGLASGEVAAWEAFFDYALQGGPWDFYADASQLDFTTYLLEDMKQDAAYKTPGFYTLKLRARKQVGWP